MITQFADLVSQLDLVVSCKEGLALLRPNLLNPVRRCGTNA